MKKVMSFLAVMCIFIPAIAQDRPEVTVELIETADFEDYDSYALVTEMKDMNMQNNWVSLEKLSGAMIENAIVYELDAAGLEKTDNAPDVIINYYIFEDKYMGEADISQVYSSINNMNKDEIMNQIGDGTLVVSIIDRTDGAVVWEGYAFDAINMKDTLRERQMSIRKGISEIMDSFVATVNLGPEVAGRN